MKRSGKILIGLLVIMVAGGGGWLWWQQAQSRLPDHIAWGNGRIEAEEIHIATKYAGRVAAVLVEEGDRVDAGQVLARMDTAELDASMARAVADVLRSMEAVAEATAQIAQRDSELRFAQQELDRAEYLVDRGHISVELAEQRQSERDAAQAALDAARAHLANTEQGVESARAEASRVQAQINDATLIAPRMGRIQYRLAEPGEVLSDGGRVVTLLDLTDVYMTIFLPTAEVGRVMIGSEARIILDALPEYVIPAKVSFVAAEAQFTPRQVETRTEREKLMFRVKVHIDRDLLLQHVVSVKTGVPGEAYVLLGADAQWPQRLDISLPPPPGQ